MGTNTSTCEEAGSEYGELESCQVETPIAGDNISSPKSSYLSSLWQNLSHLSSSNLSLTPYPNEPEVGPNGDWSLM